MTVAIATFNSGVDLVPSVRSVLDQTYTDIEVIVVDDGSTDGSFEALETIADPRLRLLRQPNQGKSVALNLIRAHARGDYLAIHDGDDRSHPERIHRQVEVMEANPRLAACFTRHDLLLGEVRFAARRLAVDEADFADHIERMRIPAIDPTGMYRMSHTAEIDYDPELRIGQGVDYMLRVGELHPMVVLGESLYSYRIVADSTTRRSPLQTHDYLERVNQRAAARRGIPFIPTPPPEPGGRAQHAFFGHILEASIENALVGDRRRTAQIAYLTLRHAKLGFDGWKPAAVTLMPKFALRRMRPGVDPEKIV